MTALEDTNPIDEEGATLLPKPKTTGIRRVVVAAAVLSFALGLLAATAVTSPGRHASNLHSKHKHETTEVDDDGACNKACPSGKDSECSWLGGDNSCTKCDTTSGTQFTCVAP